MSMHDNSLPPCLVSLHMLMGGVQRRKLKRGAEEKEKDNEADKNEGLTN